MDWGQIATTVAPLVIGALAGKKAKANAAQSSQGARLQDLLPQMQALMQQTQQRSAENYAAQQQKYALSQPLQLSIAQMANSLLPIHAQQQMPPMGGGGSASLASAPSALPMPSVADLESGYTRRGGGTGGVLSGMGHGAMTGLTYGKYTGAGIVPAMAGGALIGGIRGAVTKHAKSAPTDFTVADAHSILSRAYQQYFGHPADPQQIEQAIVGQGWQPGDRWVGEGGLNAILHTWQQQSGH